MKRLLIVEDEPDYAAGLATLFIACGFEVSMAYNGEEAVDKTRREVPDLILMDITMPRMNGFEACRVIRSGVATHNIPIIALSGRASPEDKKEAMEAGIDEYVVKPYRHTRLVEMVGGLIRKGRSPAGPHPTAIRPSGGYASGSKRSIADPK